MSTHTGRREEEAGGVGWGRGYSNRRAPGDQWSLGCRCRAAALGRPCVRESFENSEKLTAERAAQGDSGHPSGRF